MEKRANAIAEVLSGEKLPERFRDRDALLRTVLAALEAETAYLEAGGDPEDAEELLDHLADTLTADLPDEEMMDMLEVLNLYVDISAETD